MSLVFGEYAEVYASNQIKSNQIKNNNEERTISAVALYPSGNQQNGWIFMSLNTGRAIHRHQWKKLHINQTIIDRVDQIGARENQTFISNNFRYRLGQNKRALDDDDVSTETNNESEQNSTEEGNIDTPQFHEICDNVNVIMTSAEEMETERQAKNENSNDTNNYDEIVATNDETHVEGSNNDEIPDVVNSNMEADMNAYGNEDDNKNSDNVSIDTSDNNSTNVESEVDECSTKDDEVTINLDKGQEESRGPTSYDDNVAHGYNLRGRGNINYKSMHRYGETQLMQIQKRWIQDKSSHVKDSITTKKVHMRSNDLYRRTIRNLFTQLSKVDKYAQVPVNEGIRRHGEKAVAAVLNDFSQLNDIGVFKTRRPNELKTEKNQKH